MVFSHEQKVFMAVSRMIAGSLSLMASSIIVYKIYARYRAGRSNSSAASITANPLMTTYHRMLLGISIMDIIHSLGAVPGTVPVPASTGVVFGHGNAATCALQGFMVQFASAVPVYTACLTTYFMLKIRYNISDTTIRQRYEPWFHAVPWFLALATSSLGAALKIFNPINIPEMGCWVAPYPRGCSIRGGCTRGYKIGELLDMYVWVWSYGWLFASFIVVVVNSTLIYASIRHQERRNSVYLAARLQRLSTIQKQQQHPSTPLTNSMGNNTISTNSITSNTDRHCLDISHTTAPDEASMRFTVKEVPNKVTKPDDSDDVDASMMKGDVPSSQETHPSFDVKPPCIEPKKSVKITTNDDTIFVATESTKPEPKRKSFMTAEGSGHFNSRVLLSSLGSMTSGSIFLRNSSHHHPSRSSTVSASRVAAVQCGLYCLASFFTAIWIFMPWFGWKIGAATRTRVFYAFASCFIAHIQGVFNLFIFVRLQYSRLRETETEWSRFKCIVVCLTSPASIK